MIHLGFHIGRKILLVFFFTEFHRFFWHEHSGVEGPGPREKDLLHMQMCHSVCKCAQYANEVAVADWRTRSVEKRKKAPRRETIRSPARRNESSLIRRYLVLPGFVRCCRVFFWVMIGVSNSSSRRFGVEKKNGDPMTCAASPVVPFYNKKSFFSPKIMFFQTKIKLGNGSATGAVDVGVYRAVFALIFFTFFYALIFRYLLAAAEGRASSHFFSSLSAKASIKKYESQ